MASLKQEVQIIANVIGKPNDHPTKKMIKAMLSDGMGKYVKQQISKYGVSEAYVGHTIIDLERVKVGENCTGGTGCYILRSVNKIPTPIVYKASEPFVNVSTNDGVRVAIKTTRTNAKRLKYTRYLHSIMTYDYRNGYLYVYNNLVIKHLLIDFIPTDFKYLDGDANCENCYSEDYEFLLDGELLQALRYDIYKELGYSHSEPIDVPINPKPEDGSSAPQHSPNINKTR